MDMYSITKTITHPQWGAPMEFHRIVRVEVDMGTDNTYVALSSYYNETAYENGAMSMSTTTIHLKGSVLRNEQDLVQAIVDSPDNVLSDGLVDINTAPIIEE